jgi:hypothetical protein
MAGTNESHALDRYWRARDDRLSDDERRALYASVFADPFDELWTALLADLAAGDASLPSSAAAVRRLLGARIDEHLLRATPLVYAELRTALDVLSDREILEAHGAHDLWQLIEQRARLDLGVEPHVARVRTLAAAGAEVIAWLAASSGGDEPSEEAVEAAQSWLAAGAAPE